MCRPGAPRERLGRALAPDRLSPQPFPGPCSRSKSQARRTCRSVVRICPTARRSTNRPSSRVCDKKTFPVALTASRSSAFSWSSCSLSRPVAAGRTRKQTTENGTGARRSNYSSASIQSAKSRASRLCSGSRRRLPSAPKCLRTIQSLSARNRRPSWIPVSIRFRTGSGSRPCR